MARAKVVRPWWQSWWFISIVVVLFCFVFGALSFRSLREPSTKPTPTATPTGSLSPTG